MENHIDWSSKKKILIILAHPDDPEFFFGATIAKLTQEGHEIHYCLLTRGDKGSSDRNMKPETLAAMREIEQNDAAKVLGVSSVMFLNYFDGFLSTGDKIRVDVTRVVRRLKPDIVITSDPTNYFPRENRVNHPDHRAAGQIVIDAIIPGSGNPMYYPELLAEGLDPHSIEELWFSIPAQPNLVLDVSKYWEKKIEALLCHRSQIGDPEIFKVGMRKGNATPEQSENPRFEEKFRRFILS